jgi:cytochrome c553
LTFVAFGLTMPTAWTTTHAAAQGPATFTKDVAPILQRSCENCHREGGVAPMALTTYEQVRPWARSIKTRTAQREMPPWFIEKNIGIQKFKDDPSLSDAEIATIAAWVDAGAPRGNPADMPPPRQYASAAGWTIGTPDLIVSSPAKTIEAVAADWFGALDPVPTGLTEDRYIKAVEIKEVRLQSQPQEKRVEPQGVKRAALNIFVVHHAVVAVAADGQAGGSDEESALGRPDAFNITYELGQNATVFPDNVGVKLPARSVLTFDRQHYHSVGTEVVARIDVAFTFHPKGYQPKYRQSVVAMPLEFDFELDIPAGQNNVMRDAFYRLAKPGILMTFEPHLHSSGKRMCMEALYPNGKREMLSCAGYNHNWVKVYTYEDDVAPLLPTGTVLHFLAWYDNTAGNPRVVDPRNWKGWGNRSIDDMFYHLPRMVLLTEEQYKEEAAAREAKRQKVRTSTAAQP